MMFNLPLALALLVTSPLRASAEIALPNGMIAVEEYNLLKADTVHHEAPDGKQSVAIRWIGQAFRGGDNITIIGRDLHEIGAKLKEINPELAGLEKRNRCHEGDPDDCPVFDPENPYDGGCHATLCPGRYPLEGNGYHMLCNRPEFHDGSMFYEGVDYLLKFEGTCLVIGPTGSCNRCSCSWSSGIWICNDSTRGETHQEIPCSLMGLAAGDLLISCGLWDNQGRGNAQYFNHSSEWSVLMAEADC